MVILLYFRSKLLKYLNLVCNMKLLLQHGKENIEVFLLGRMNYTQFLVPTGKNLKKLANFF